MPVSSCATSSTNVRRVTCLLRRTCKMRLQKTPLIALVAALMLASCSSLPPPVIAPPKPLPLDYAAPCPATVAPTDDSADAVLLALKKMYDLYGTCAGRLIDLGDWVTNNKQKTQENHADQQ